MHCIHLSLENKYTLYLAFHYTASTPLLIFPLYSFITLIHQHSHFHLIIQQSICLQKRNIFIFIFIFISIPLKTNANRIYFGFFYINNFMFSHFFPSELYHYYALHFQNLTAILSILISSLIIYFTTLHHHHHQLHLFLFCSFDK